MNNVSLKMLEEISRHNALYGLGPSTRDLAEAAEIASTSTVDYHITKLIVEGLVSVVVNQNGRRISRAIRLTDLGEGMIGEVMI